ncbi:MAG: 50S ribosomal protein L23 [Bacteroidetes bacterium]|nr:50S ribosomal protein L23 [Bacteroidota bacterium]
MAVIVKPLITEKSSRLSEKLNQFAFVVDKDASKPEIIKEIEAMYGVEVTDISTMVVRGKRKFRLTKAGYVNGKKSNYKKAIVSLKDDQTIDFYESV